MRIDRLSFALLLMVVTLAVPVSAQGISRMSTVSGLTAIGTAGSFEVLTRAGTGKADYFCAAGDFAFSRLNARNTDRVVVIGGMARSQYVPNRNAVTFTIRSGGKVGVFGSGLAGPRAGQRASVGHARALCSQTRVNRMSGR